MRSPNLITLRCQELNQWVASLFIELQKREEERKKKKRFDQEKQALLRQLTKHIQKLQKKELYFLEAIDQCKKWEEVRHEGELIKAHFSAIRKGSPFVEVWNWLTNQSIRLALDPLKSPQEEMAKRFKRAQKLKRGITPLLEQLERTQKQRQEHEEMQKKVVHLESVEELAQVQAKMAPSSLGQVLRQKIGPPSIYREYQSATGIKIWVGKSAKANDQLTFQLANGRDVWLHVKGCPGSHVLIRMPKEENPDPETLEDAMQLALYYSKARSQGEGEICWTQRKYVSRLGKQRKAGQVQISKHHIQWIRLDLTRYQALKERINC